MAKQDVQEYIFSLLTQLDCKGITINPTGNLHCQCPFHRPRRNVTAFGVSFVNEKRGYPFNCQSCGENGNLAQLVQYAHKVPYRRALKMLKRNIVLTPITMARLRKSLQALSDHSRQAVEEVHTVKLPPRSTNQSPMVRYMEKRASKARDVMDPNYIIQKYNLYYCGTGRMRGRIIMPIHIDGRCKGINDRAVDDSVRNKSLHIAGQEYNELLYGLDEARGKRIGVLVEGAFDLYQVTSACKTHKDHRHFGIVGNMGTAFSEVKASLLADYFDELVVMFDNQVNDKGKNMGLISAMKVEAMMKEIMPVRNVTLDYPKGKDPGICTTNQILDALYSEGFKFESRLDKMRKNSRLIL